VSRGDNYAGGQGWDVTVVPIAKRKENLSVGRRGYGKESATSQND